MSYILLEFFCDQCQERFESLESRSAIPPSLLHPPCGTLAERVISAVKFKTKYGTAVTTAKSDPLPPKALDTSLLADGVSQSDFKKIRRKRNHEKRWQQIKSIVG